MTIRSYLTTLKLLYASLLMSILIFLAIAYWMVTSNETPADASLEEILMFTTLGAALAGLAAGYFVFKSLIAKIPPTATLKTKLMEYQKAVIIRFACLEFPAMLGIVSAIITGGLTFFYVPAALIFIFIMLRPTPQAVIEDLALERTQLEDPNAELN